MTVTVVELVGIYYPKAKDKAGIYLKAKDEAGIYPEG